MNNFFPYIIIIITTQLDEVGDNDNDNNNDESDIEDNVSINENDDLDSYSRNSTQLKITTSDMNRSIGRQMKEANVSQIAHTSVVNINEWKLECERVAPKLRSSQRRINSEWRQRVDQASDSASKVDSILSSSQIDLTSLSRYVRFI
jgi:hypothetical protein